MDNDNYIIVNATNVYNLKNIEEDYTHLEPLELGTCFSINKEALDEIPDNNNNRYTAIVRDYKIRLINNESEYNELGFFCFGEYVLSGEKIYSFIVDSLSGEKLSMKDFARLTIQHNKWLLMQ